MVLKTTPLLLSTACRRRASWRARAARIASGCSSQSRVLPSMSVKRKVTVPVGQSMRMLRRGAMARIAVYSPEVPESLLGEGRMAGRNTHSLRDGGDPGNGFGHTSPVESVTLSYLSPYAFGSYEKIRTSPLTTTKVFVY